VAVIFYLNSAAFVVNGSIAVNLGTGDSDRRPIPDCDATAMMICSVAEDTRVNDDG
jgi:hypothetical protein